MADSDTDAASVWDRIEDADADSVADTVANVQLPAIEVARSCAKTFFLKGEGVGALLGALDTKK